MRHTDESYALMLLTLPMSASGSETPRPLDGEEAGRVAAQLSLAGNRGLDSLMGLDVPGVMRALDTSEDAAYRICLLLDRDMQLGRLIEECEGEDVQIVTPLDAAYPALISRRLGQYMSPALFARGSLSLAQGDSIGILGVSGVKTDERAAKGVKALCLNAAANGFGLVTCEEPGVCRLALKSALELGGRLICPLAGGLHAFGAQVTRALEEGSLLLLSQTHPRHQALAADERERTRLMMALSRAAFIVTTDGKRGEIELAKKANCGYVYVYDDDAYPQNRSLLGRDFIPVDELGYFDIATNAALWTQPEVQQLSFL